MCRKRRWLSFALCSLLLFSAPATAWADGAAEQTYSISAEKLNRLNEIWARLETLNTKLQGELATSKEDLRKLQDELTGLRDELEQLKKELEASQQESTQLRKALQKADDYLASLEGSFKEYQQAAEKRIRNLETQRTVAVIAAILALLGNLLPR